MDRQVPMKSTAAFKTVPAPPVMAGLILCVTLLAVAKQKPAEARQTPSLTPPAGIQMPSRGISSHRGANHTHPENTLPAFREAIRVGAHQIELDIRLTDHGDLIVIHDATVDRTTDGTGPVREMTLDQIKQLDAGSWMSRKFTGVRVPTLDEALRIMPDNVWLNLDLKDDDAELGRGVARTVIEHGRAHQSIFAARPEAAAGVRQVWADLLICNMNRTRSTPNEEYVAETLARGHQFIQFRAGPGTPEQVAKLRQAGVRINYCCTNEPDDLEDLFARGIEFPLVDDLHAMMQRAVQLGITPLEPVYLDKPVRKR